MTRLYDVVIPLRDRPSIYNDMELKYCLRAIDKYFPVRDVWIIGTPRDWLSVNWIEQADLQTNYDARHEAVRQKLIKACECDYISDPFALFNDDFILTKPIDVLHDYYDGTIDDRLKDARGGYRDKMARSKELSKDGLNYETHVPCMIDKKNFNHTVGGALYRNIAVSYSDREKVPIKDPKLYTMEDHQNFRALCKKNWCVSLSEGSLNYVLRDLDRMFPDPSKWE